MFRRALLVVWICTVWLPQVQAESYRSVLKKWTKSGKIYSMKNLEANLIWYATYFSKQFSIVYISEYTRRKRMTPLETAQWTAMQEKERSKYHRFFISLYSKPYRQFSKHHDSFWKIRLITDSGETIEPLSISQTPTTLLIKQLFPYIDRWSKTYTVTFPRVSLGKDFKLEIYSVIGSSVLNFHADE